MKIFTFFTLFFTLLFTGCTEAGPDFVKPKAVNLPSSWDKNTTVKYDKIARWWQIFDDKTLNILIKKMYEQNFDLRSAALRILQARAALGISQGFTYPQQQNISGSFALTRQNGNNFLAAGTNFTVGWEMDVWGRYARNIESSEALLYASAASYDDILVSLISEVARNYINYTTALERIAFAEHNIQIQQKIMQMTQIQFNNGNVSELDMQQAKTQLYTTKSLIPAFKLKLIQSRNALSVLLGCLPEDVDKLLSEVRIKEGKKFIPDATLDQNFQVNAQLLTRRPDIRVAELQAEAQNAKIGAIQAQLYPHFSLFGSIGFTTNNVQNKWVTLGDAIGISAGPAFSWNIFQYDRIKNQVRVQDAKFQESLNHYNKTVLMAVNEVTNALNGYRLSQEQLSLTKQTIEANQRALDISMTQYENGMTGYERLLNATEKLIRNEDNYAQIKGEVDIQIVLLYKALGGGWQLRGDDAYLKKKDVEQMSKRSDWGDYFKAEKQ